MSERLMGLTRLIESGVHPSLPNDQVPFWKDGRDILFRERSVQPFPGSQVFVSKGQNAEAQGVLETLIAGKKNLFWGTHNHLYRFQDDFAVPAAAAQVTRAAAGPVVTEYTGIINASATQLATKWSMIDWGNWVLATNGVDLPQIWKTTGADNYPAAPDGNPEFIKWSEAAGGADLGDTSRAITTAEIVKVIGPYAILFNTSNDPRIAEWCDTDAPQVFNETAANAAGALFFRDMHSAIVAAEDLGPLSLAVYSSDQMHVFEFIGAPFYFGERQLLNGIGALSKQSVTSHQGIQYGAGPRGIWRSDGHTYEYIDDPSIHDFIYDDMEGAQQSKTIAWSDPGLDLVMFSYPTAGSLKNVRTVGYRPKTRAWTILSWGRSAVSPGTIFQNPIMIDIEGNVKQQEAPGSPATLEPRQLDLLAAFTHAAGYGHLGYGDGGYGGEWYGDG